jgi:hypothetical protein
MNIVQYLAHRIEGDLRERTESFEKPAAPLPPKPRKVFRPKPPRSHPWNRAVRVEREESEFKKEHRHFRETPKPEYTGRDVQVGIDIERQLIREAVSGKPVVKEPQW